jgi:hypothetical protein
MAGTQPYCLHVNEFDNVNAAAACSSLLQSGAAAVIVVWKAFEVIQAAEAVFFTKKHNVHIYQTLPLAKCKCGCR